MKIAVWGGGISGLSAAWQLRKQHEVVLFEKSDRLGGAVWTDRSQEVLFERGPRTFVWNRSPALRALIEETGLAGEILRAPSMPRYLWLHGKLRTISSLWPHLVGPLLRELFVPKGEKEETVAQFAKRRLGPFIAQHLVDPFTRGVWGAPSDLLSADATIGPLVSWERRYGSLLWGALRNRRKSEGLFTLRRGMGSLVERLAQDLEVRRGEPQKGEWDQIIVALPFDEAMRHFGCLPLTHSHLTVVNLAYRRKEWPLRGYGYLVPQSTYLGAIFDSSIFPEQDLPGTVRATVFLETGGVEEAVRGLREHVGIQEEPFATLTTHARLPHYSLGHIAKMANLPNTAIGNYRNGLSVEACVRNAMCDFFCEKK